jgi:hypothetical protein
MSDADTRSYPETAELARKAALFREGAKRIYEGQGAKADMWYFELFHFLDDVEKALSDAQRPTDRGYIDFEYTNWEGRKTMRCARPISVRFGKSEWHPKPQWLLLAFDIERAAEREFAMADMGFEGDALAALSLSSTEGK